VRPGPRAALLATLASVLPACASAAPRWTLVWSDEFAGPAGALVDATKWVSETGGHGWGNEELQYYTDRARNAHLTGDGFLVIEAQREAFTGPDGTRREYTSARLKTQQRFDHAYGRFEARLQVPRGQGIWPAFWMLGADIGTAGWPRCGEIDVMENIGREPGTVHGTLHGPGYAGAGAIGRAFSLPAGRRDLPAGARWAFDHPFFLLLNVAVGGRWPGSPDATTDLPQALKVDYVRVYAEDTR
jgi:beta-glucanase (GH16 family)